MFVGECSLPVLFGKTVHPSLSLQDIIICVILAPDVTLCRIVQDNDRDETVYASYRQDLPVGSDN